MNIVAFIILITLLSIAMYTDIKFHKIRNWLTLPAMLIGLVILSFQFTIMSAVLYFSMLIAIGIIAELFRLWRSGDTKLVVATGLWLALALQELQYINGLILYFSFIASHLIIGHLFGLKKYNFQVKTYIQSMFTGVNESYGRFAGAITISLSVGVVLVLKYIVAL